MNTKRTSLRMREAVEQKDLDKVRSLLDDGEDVNSMYDSSLYWTLLAWVISIGSTEIANLLLDKGADAEVEDIEGNTPLILAVIEGQLDIVDLLLSKGVSLKHQTRSGWNALDYARSYKHWEIMRRLEQSSKPLE